MLILTCCVTLISLGVSVTDHDRAHRAVDVLVGLLCVTVFVAFYALNRKLMACRAARAVRVMGAAIGDGKQE